MESEDLLLTREERLDRMRLDAQRPNHHWWRPALFDNSVGRSPEL
jgi:hypothetical protein